MMLTPCKTDGAVFLVAVPDAAGVLRFPEIKFTVAPVLPINEQLQKAAAACFGKDVTRHLDICQEFQDEMGTETLYVATLAPAAGIVAPPTWTTMPDLLRKLAGRARVPYMRAWQILAGGLTLNTKAVDMAEVQKHFDD